MTKLLGRYWFSLGLSAIFLGAIALRFWQLDRIKTLVFDEVYYVKYAVAYLTNQAVFDAHPPFAKYLMALGIWLGENLWFRGAEPRVAVEGLVETVHLSPLSFRWLNALVGSTLPLLIAGIALELSQRRSLALLAGLFATFDGFLLVESRHALLHVYLIAFGLLGQWCFLKALRSQPSTHFPNLETKTQNLAPTGSKSIDSKSIDPKSTDSQQWLLNAGLSFAAAIAVKWNGLGYWLVPAGIWFSRHRNRWFSGLAYLAIAPALFYSLLWLPHLSHQTDVGFLTVHQQILGFHQGMDDEAGAAHPYCSPWWSWPLMLRPIAYFFQTSADGQWRYSIQAMGNPVLWWLATGAIVLLCIAWIWSFWKQGRGQLEARPNQLESFPPQALPKKERCEEMSHQSPLLLGRRDRWVASYLVLNYAANWLPWLIVKRCTFTYHHLGAMCFGIIAVAFWCERWFRLGGRSLGEEWRWGSLVIGGAIAVAFVFWLPLYLGLPLSELGLKLRLWLPSWT